MVALAVVFLILSNVDFALTRAYFTIFLTVTVSAFLLLLFFFFLINELYY